MGKLALFLVAGSMVASVVILSQASETSLESTRDLTERQEEILAREAARSGYNVAHNKIAMALRTGAFAKTEDAIRSLSADSTADDAAFFNGTFRGGTYQTSIVPLGHTAYSIESRGSFRKANASVGTEALVTPGVLKVTQPSLFRARFIESQAGFCSAIYLERSVPKVEGDFEGEYETLEPEIIFAAGKNRDGAEANYETELAPGTQLNFIISVVADRNGWDCSPIKGLSDDELRALPYDDPRYSYHHRALDLSAGLGEMQEGFRALVEKNAGREGNYDTWRIAFEDIDTFTAEQHNDIKRNGYGKGSKPEWELEKHHGASEEYWSYGGNPRSDWPTQSSTGYRKLRDFGGTPDFSDQVFEIELLDPAALAQQQTDAPAD